MTDTPRKVLMQRQRTDQDDIGKELFLAHKLFSRLRKLGASRKDINGMAETSDAVLEHLIAGIRGVIKPDQDDGSQHIINLDKLPNLDDLPREASGITAEFLKLHFNLQLGMWPYDGIDWSEFGDMRFDVRRPIGGCVHGDVFMRNQLLHAPKIHVDLNYACAYWISQQVFLGENIFQMNMFDREWVEETLYFLGTIWKAGRAYYAPALVSDDKGDVHFKIKVLPKGEWPSTHHFIAILVPK